MSDDWDLDRVWVITYTNEDGKAVTLRRQLTRKQFDELVGLGAVLTQQAAEAVGGKGGN